MRVVLVDDHELVRRGVRELLEARGIEVAGDFGPLPDLHQRVLALVPDVVLLDLSMPGEGGIDYLKRWKLDSPHLPILVLSMHVEEPWVGWATAAGADGYLSKSAGPDELVKAIGELARGGRYFSAQVAHLKSLESRAGLGVQALTKKEKEVLRQVGQGATLTELAVHFVVSRNTAKTHLHSLYRKFGVSDRAQLLVKAKSLGLLD